MALQGGGANDVELKRLLSSVVRSLKYAAGVLFCVYLQEKKSSGLVV